MYKLEDAKLYRTELVTISGKLVDRYNQCLKMLGIGPTGLTTFSIDGIGWSPEVADEKNEADYLNIGGANPSGIIITPQQHRKPVYNPFHTFDRDMMNLVFEVHGTKINDITRDCAICIDFDQQIDTFYEPLDVLKYGHIKINFRLLNRLNHAQKEQLQLVETFKKRNNFIDENIHAKLLQSAKMYGDLRNRDLDLYSLDYSVSSFYTKAFNGVYVLRDFIMPIVVFEDIDWYRNAIKDTVHDVLIFHILQPELIQKMRDHLIIEYNLENVVKTDRYDRVKKFVFAQYLKVADHPLSDILNDAVLFKSYLNKFDLDIRKKIMGVELYLEKLERSNQYKLVDMVDLKIFQALHQPHSSLSTEHQELVWKLLVNVSPLDVLFFFWYDKEDFFKAYNSWDDSLQDWVIETIRNNFGQF